MRGDAMTDREKYLTILDRFYRGRGASLLTKDEREALDYAISSIKTDLKYDLLYEETTHIADADKMIEPTTKNCESCRYYGLQQEVCNYCYKCSLWTEIKSTTKNDLGVENDLVSSIVETISEKVTETREEFIFETIRPYCEDVVQMKISKRELEQALLKYYGKNDLAVDCISRIETIDYLCKHCPDDGECFEDCDEIKHLRQMPSVTPQEPILDKIRAEIGQITSRYSISRERGGMGQVEWSDNLIKESEVLKILDKYKAESEEK